eukprot:Skav225069  [mRNA]  locus=scaffold2293:183533:184602:- [translate_table: standard]
MSETLPQGQLACGSQLPPPALLHALAPQRAPKCLKALQAGGAVAESCQRWAKAKHGQQVFEAHFRLGNPNVPIPAGQDIRSLAERVIQVFEELHRLITMSQEARGFFAGLQACANSTAAQLRNEQADHLAARNGIMPWHVGLLAASNLIWEIACGQRLSDMPLELQEPHVPRAWSQVTMSHSLIDIWCAHGGNVPVEDSVAATLSPAEKLAAATEAGPLSLSQFEAADMSQVPEEAQEALADEDGSFRLLTLMDETVPSLETGYGVDGKSVQDGDRVMSDRVSWLRRGICAMGS